MEQWLKDAKDLAKSELNVTGNTRYFGQMVILFIVLAEVSSATIQKYIERQG